MTLSLVDVLLQVGDTVLTRVDRALVRLTCREAHKRLRLERDTGVLCGNELSVREQLARWALAHEVATFDQLWYGACRRADSSALAWVQDLCPDTLKGDRLWRIAVMAGEVEMLDQLWAWGVAYPSAMTFEAIDIFDEFEPEEWCTSVAIQYNRTTAFNWLRSMGYPVCHGVVQYAVRPNQSATFDLLEQEGFFATDEAVHAAIECGNMKLVRRMIASGAGLDDFAAYDEAAILHSALSACEDEAVVKDTAAAEAFVEELYNMGFLLTMQTIDYTFRSDYRAEQVPLPIVFSGALRGLTREVCRRQLHVASERDYCTLCQAVANHWLLDEDGCPQPAAVWAALHDLLSALAPREL